MENTRKMKSAVVGFAKKADEKRRKLMLRINTFAAMCMVSVATSVAAFAEGGGEASTTVTDADSTFDSVINFFADWIGKIGLVVGFIGAIQFALAIKNDDADAKTRGLMTMASGFVVFAITLSLSLFGITKTSTTSG